MSNVIEVPQEILDSTRLSVSDLRVELALQLYENKKLSMGKAHELAEKSLWEFRQLLASRGISPHLEKEDLEEGVKTLRELGRL